jgi:GntR family transcriptional regulator
VSRTSDGAAPTLQRVGAGSLTGRTTRVLLDAIMNREFVDDRLPPEPELAEQLAVSRTTIRAALQSLERLGVLSRIPGRGTMVRAHVGRESIILQRLSGFRDLLEERHDKVEVDQSYELRSFTDDLGQRLLGVPAETPVIVSSKTFFADGHPAIYISDQIPIENCSASLRQTLIAGDDLPVQDSIFEFSRQWPGREIDHTVVELLPAVAPAEGSTLDLKDGTPFMRLIEAHYTIGGEAVAVSEVHVDDKYVRFSVVRHD